MITDPWLHRWLPLLRERAGTDFVFEIGCGHGDDTAIMASAGLSVFAFDLSRTAVSVTSVRVPSATVQCRDLREPFPEQVHEVGAIVASLSLHYFAWDETQVLVQRIRSTLRPGGILLCRLNSTQDHNFGASGHAELEPHLFLVEGSPKRFFDRESVELLFNEGWNKLSMEHYVTSKYVKPKALWEIVLERSDA
ncbi:class I SAM-dependent methyltransferase [Vreelandella nigrificans]|uniref:SAM-dependent methyltransferase n=1 Tax=Vreelandella nigrificans TaxID=2042704 RepID=A0A2A4HJP4_9GAMM|nr:class I SAM-dependent methyltransferase [Halomonas nigrificans]PCF94331.1 SAM-dependent methyltransferase [Halomonas nigrificans]